MTRNLPYSLRLGGLVSQSLSAYFRNLLPFTFLAVIVLLPWIVWRIYMESAEPTAAFPVVAVVLQQLGGQVLTGALTYGVVQHMRSEAPNLAKTIAVGVQSFLRVLLVGIVVGLLIGLGTLLLVVPGIILTMCFYVAIPAAVLERLGVGAAMKRSLELTRGSRWQIFGAVVLCVIIVMGSVMLITFVLVSTADFEAMPLWFELVLNVVMLPFGSAMAGVCYYMLRSGKENVEAAQIAAVFD